MCAYASLPATIGKTIYCFHLQSVNKAKMVRTLYLKREFACITQIKQVALGLSFTRYCFIVFRNSRRLGAQSLLYPTLCPVYLPSHGNQTDPSSHVFTSISFSYYHHQLKEQLLLLPIVLHGLEGSPLPYADHRFIAVSY